MRRAYLTDLSDVEWAYLEAHLPAPQPYGRPLIHSPREILNAVFYVLKSECAWRLLPHDFPPWKTVHHYFRTARALANKVGKKPTAKRGDGRLTVG